MLINIKLNVEHYSNFWKIKVGLIIQIIKVDFSGILDITLIEDLQMIKGKQLDGMEF